jgi:hypothetical protein
MNNQTYSQVSMALGGESKTAVLENSDATCAWKKGKDFPSIYTAK